MTGDEDPAAWAGAVTHILVVADLEASRDFYRDVLGVAVDREYGGTSCVLRFAENWLLLVTGGEPTPDKPSVTFAPPADPDRVTNSFTVRVADCWATYALLMGRGATFLTEPVEYTYEIRAFLRDPDGHLWEISETKS